MMQTPSELLNRALDKATKLGDKSAVRDKHIHDRIDLVCRCLGNRAGVRLLMSCMLAKLDRPEIDPRKPYTEIGGNDSFSGRTYDERFLTAFINKHRLPCNSTTAYLTPALRNQDSMLTPSTILVGRPPQVYEYTLQILDDVAEGRVSAEAVLTEAVRILISMRDDKDSRMKGLIKALKHVDDALPLSTEGIVSLLQQHLACKHSSRLPVLIVAAAYECAASRLGEKACDLKGHLSADGQSGAMGDIEICLTNDARVVTVYEMKSKHVTRDDIDRALQKIVDRVPRIDNYLFITTETPNDDVREYAKGIYDQT